MEAVGRLASGVAHEFNNALTAIVGYSDLLKERVGGNDSLRQIDIIRSAGDRAANLTRQLLALGRRQVLQPAILDLNRLLKEVEQVLRVSIDEKIDLVMRTDPALGSVKADRGQIEQIVTNLVLNARDAMPDGGRITVETSNISADAAYSREHQSVPPGDYVMLRVSDTGVGMDPETQSHLFEPFFTTKPKGVGTGLGLSTIYSIVNESNGHIWAYSELGHGATFQVYFPRVMDEGAEEHPPAQSLAGTETVLVVEDDPVVRRLTESVLEGRGYRVLTAGNGPEALQTLKRHKDSISLLLTDVVMPQMSGRELADRLASQRPGTRIVFMSGHAEDAIVHHGVLEPGVTLIQKPFTPQSLLEKIRGALDSGE